MTQITATIEFHTYWQAGSGEGLRPDIDALALRDADNLPYLPGKTLKGIWREAMQTAEDAGMIKTCSTAMLFGEHSGCNDEAVPPSKGLLSFSNAVPEQKFTAWLRSQDRSVKDQLFHYLSSTRLKNGIAVDKTLRSIEVCLPIILTAEITCLNPEKTDLCRARLAKTCGLIKSIGFRRHRGLGRCQVSVTNI